ncbi:hypothetical protein JMJ56_09255 [Belnapia sp. T18]|uniref:Uncharacterized protein n=1 Tax=Belnapia arida TaxID=2804533 RepID=A0ABS1U4G7_9PROT|nr:hypothetical protein [Belnapia arida]MBL6078191.1 hypothetical protein [Belnapia arida]
MIEEGMRIGRYLIVRDVDGRFHALSAAAVLAVCDDSCGGSMMLLPGGRAVRLDQSIETVLTWLNHSGP